MTEDRHDPSALDHALARWARSASELPDAGFTGAVAARVRRRRWQRRILLAAAWLAASLVAAAMLPDATAQHAHWRELARVLGEVPSRWGPLLALLVTASLGVAAVRDPVE